MKVLIYGLNYAPELVGIGKYTGELGAWLAKQGCEIRVLAAPPYYPSWQVTPPYSCIAYRSEVIDGVKVLRCPIWVPKTPSGLSRIFHLASFTASTFPALLTFVAWRPDVIIVVVPTLMCALQGVLLARTCGAKSWIHVQDFEVDAAFELGILRNPGLRGVFTACEHWILRCFDVISTISEKMLSLAIAKRGLESGAVLFPNWVDVNQESRVTGVSPMRKQLGIPDDEIVILYSGSMGAKQGLEFLPEVAKRLVGEADIGFVFCGDGPGKLRLVESCRGLTNVKFLDLQPPERLNDLLGIADIHLLPQHGSAADLVMPSKLTGMLASGKAIIATAAKDTQIAVVLSNRGVVVEPGDPDLLVSAIRMLARNPTLRGELGSAARAYAEQHLSKERVLGRFLGELTRLAGTRSA